jgi:integrase
MIAPHVTVYHDTRREKSGGVYPVKLKVHYNYTDKRYALGIDLNKEDFRLSYLTQKPKLQKHREAREEILALELKAKKIIRELDPFDYARFEKMFFRPTASVGNVFYRYECMIADLEREERPATASSYALSQQSLKRYLQALGKRDDHLAYDAVTADFLKGYERWMLRERKSLTTVGIYLRPLRALFNQAIEEREISRDHYPFGQKKYQIPAGRNAKKALKREDLKKLLDYSSEDPCIRRARALWFFSFSSNGINIRDLCELRYKNIKGDTLEFIRTKTKRTTRTKQVTIVAGFTEKAREVIKEYGNTPLSPDTYVFPIFRETMTADEKLRATQNLTRFINQHIKRLAKLAGVTENISTYSARHSYSTLSRQAGRSLEFIQSALGHQNITTTMAYINSLESEEIKKNAEQLMDL